MTEIVGDYQFNRKDLIGHGAFAVVFKGRHREQQDLTVAIKSITKKSLAKSQSLLEKEIKILEELTKLQHENVVCLLDCKETPQYVYIVMEYCNGGDLADYLLQRGTLSEDTIRLFTKQICGAMRALQSKGIIHRDLKPQNILLCHDESLTNPSSNDITLKIADFGFARFLQDGVMAATLCGSPQFMAVEILLSKPYDCKADLWSIGTILYQCLTGKAPFQAHTPQALRAFYEKTLDLKPKLPPDTSAELKHLLVNLLKRDPKDRISFEDLYEHPFLKPPKTQPMAVPNRTTAATATGSRGGSINSCSSPRSIDHQQSRRHHHHHHHQQQQQYQNQHDNRSSSSKPHSAASSPGTGGMSYAGNGLGSPMSLGYYQHHHTTRTVSGNIRQQQQQQSGHNNAHAYVGSYESARNRSNSSRYSGRRGDSSSFNPLNTTPVDDSSANLSDSSDTVVGGDFVMVSTREACQAANELMGISPMSTSSSSQQQQQQKASPSSVSSGTSSSSLNNRRAMQPQMKQQQQQHSPKLNRSQARSHTPPSPLQQLPPPLSPPQLSASPNHHFHQLNYFNISNSSSSSSHAGRHSRQPFQEPTISTTTNTPSTTAITTRRPSFGHTLTDVTNISPTLRFSLGSPGMSRFSGGASGGQPPFGTHSATSPHHHQENLGPGGSPPVFYALDLPEETLLDKEHNETLAKLTFVDLLVECILALADSRSALINHHTNLNEDESKPKALLELPVEIVRKVERLVLYTKASQLTSSALKLSHAEMQANRLRNSSSVRQVLRLLKDKFHHCLDMCKSLEYQATLSSTIGRAALELIAPDKLIYDYAIEMCQTAALEEMFGQPEECFKRYQTAQILLHGLLHQVNQDDKPLLEKYKMAVEKRLVTLQYQYQQQQQQILGASSSSNMGNPFSGLGGGQKRNSSHCSYE